MVEGGVSRPARVAAGELRALVASGNLTSAEASLAAGRVRAAAGLAAGATEGALRGANALLAVVLPILGFAIAWGLCVRELGVVRPKNARTTVVLHVFGWACAAAGHALRLGDGGPVESADAGERLILWVRAAVACSIAAGGAAERVRPSAFQAYSAVAAVACLPVAYAWVWGADGWLSPQRQDGHDLFMGAGLVDTGGAAGVHLAGGLLAAVIAAALGPRINEKGMKRFTVGENVAFQEQDATMCALGVLVVMFGGHGLNSFVGNEPAIGAPLARAASSMVLSMSASAAAMLCQCFLLRRPPLMNTLNSTIGGLAAVSASPAAIDPWVALIAGGCAPTIIMLSVHVLERFSLDDPMDAVAVHAACGLWGLVVTGLFADGAYLEELYPGRTVDAYGLFMGGGSALLGAQLLGALVIACWIVCTGAATLGVLYYLNAEYNAQGKAIGGLRASPAEESDGLDAPPSAAFYYPSYMHSVMVNLRNVLLITNTGDAFEPLAIHDDSDIRGVPVPLWRRKVVLSRTYEFLTAFALDNSYFLSVRNRRRERESSSGGDILHLDYISSPPPLIVSEAAAIEHKGEDALVVIDNCGTVQGAPACAQGLSYYGVFDGHNGKAAARFCRDELVHFFLSRLPKGPRNQMDTDTFNMKIALALREAFKAVNTAFVLAHPSSGCTGTVVVVHEWVVITASVGDSYAYIDTPQQEKPLRLSANHRLTEGNDEVKRLKEAGAKVERIYLDNIGAHVGPLRVWPGGLAMSRSIGDKDVGPWVLPDPHVSVTTVPEDTFLARIVIASDGVWDAVKGEFAEARMVRCHAKRTTAQAPMGLVREAIRKRGLRDDTSCVVIDLLSDAAVQDAERLVEEGVIKRVATMLGCIKPRVGAISRSTSSSSIVSDESSGTMPPHVLNDKYAATPVAHPMVALCGLKSLLPEHAFVDPEVKVVYT